MNKKVIAVAVAAALAAPAVAVAQTTIYGKFNAEYGFTDQMDLGPTSNASRESADGFNSGASYVGIRGEEKMGGGYSVWYQCETRARWGVDTNPSQAASGICDRNSALGLKGNFGNFFVGRWDTAIETQSGNTRIVGSTGWDGRQHLLTEDQGQAGISFAQRVQNSFNYESPNWSGFSFGLSTTTSGAALNTTTATNTSSGLKGRIYSGYGKYVSGPLQAYVGYEAHDDNQAYMSGTAGGPGRDGASEHMVTVGASYQLGPVRLALVYTDADGDGITPGTDITRSTWQLGADWKITPNGYIRAVYTEADDFEGSDARASLTDQGAKQYSIGYMHTFSKRTIAGVYYTKVDNETNGVYNYHGFNSSVKPGDSAGALVFQVTHSF
jgi:predicted porin